jgi:hypothetical protein
MKKKLTKKQKEDDEIPYTDDKIKCNISALFDIVAFALQEIDQNLKDTKHKKLMNSIVMQFQELERNLVDDEIIV